MRNLLSSSYDCCTLEMIEQGSVNSKLEYLVTSLHGQNAEIIKSMETSERIHIALSLGKQMIRVLKVLHKLGYVHGDIKPHNILFDDNNFGLQTWEASDSSYKFVLIDFGIAQKYVNDEGSVLPKTKLKSFRGNLEFAAEEWLQKYSKLQNLYF